jgi:hypothetical protein
MKNIFLIVVLSIIVILIVILILILIFYSSNCNCNYNCNYNIYKHENFENNNIEIVISRYNENLEFLRDEIFNNYPVIIYNKGLNNDFYKPPSLKKIVNLPNVGVCDHTYLYHIIENYDNLANVTIFLPGSCTDEHKKDLYTNVLNKTIETNNTVIYGHCNENNKSDLYNFRLTEWISTNENNKILNSDSKLRECDIYPYGKWYDEVFPEINNNCVTYLGIFSVSKEHIHNRSKASYEKLIKFVSNSINEECAHYIERSYISIFDPLPKEVIF